MEHRQRRGPRRRQAGADRRPGTASTACAVIGVDEHVWRHTRRGDKYVTVIIDLTAGPRRHRPGPAAGHGRRPLQAGVQDVARRPRPGVARRGRGRRDGRVHRLQDRRRRGAARRGRGDGPLPRRRAWPATPSTVPTTRPAGHRAATAARRRPALRCRRTLHTGADLLTDKQTTGCAPCSPTTPTSRSKPPGASTSAWSPPTATPTGSRGRDLMARLIDSLSHGVPSRADRAHHARPDAEEASRRRPGLLRPPRHQQRPDRSDQRPPRTPPRLRPRLPQPHQLHRQIATRDRRVQTPTTPSIVKSHLSLRCRPGKTSFTRH